MPAAVGAHADDAAMRTQVKIAGCQRLGHGRQSWIPFCVIEGTEAITPRRVRGRRPPVVRHAVHPDLHRIWVKPHRFGNLPEFLAQAERAQWRHRVWLTARHEWIAVIAGHADDLFYGRVVGLQLVIAEGRVGQAAGWRQYT